MALIELNNIRLSYGRNEVLKNVSLRLQPSEFTAVLGPSGCGKTSLLRIIAGFSPYSGEVKIDGRDMADVPAHRRQIGIVFQDYALFPHQTVAENIGYGLRMRRHARNEIAKKVSELIALLKLNGLGDRYPGQLSGGQRQRVAVARALAIQPKVLLLDEPLSALDKKLREEMQVELRQIQRRIGITTLFVTHDQEEALAMADRVVVMQEGSICQIGSPKEIYMRPAVPFVADFIGRTNFLTGSVEGKRGAYSQLRLPSGEIILIAHNASGAAESKAETIAIRPERIVIARDHVVATGDRNALSGTIDHVTFMGPYQVVRVSIAGERILYVQTPNEAPWREGERVVVSWRPEDSVPLSGFPTN